MGEYYPSPNYSLFVMIISQFILELGLSNREGLVWPSHLHGIQ